MSNFVVILDLTVLICIISSLGSVIPQPIGLNAFKVGHADTIIEPVVPLLAPAAPYLPPPPPPVVPVPPPAPVVPLPLPPAPILPAPFPAVPVPAYPPAIVQPLPAPIPAPFPVPLAPPPPPPAVFPVAPAPVPFVPAPFPFPAPGPVPAVPVAPFFNDGFYGPFPYQFGLAQRLYGPAAVPAHFDENIRFPGVKVPVPSFPLNKKN